MKPAAFGLLHVIPKHLRQEDMERTIRAKFKNGVIEPLEKLELEERAILADLDIRVEVNLVAGENV